VDTELAGARKAALESRAPTVDSTQPSRVLSYKDIREAHHIMEAAKAGKKW
jgi:hypothetical protein